jgi:hypothetical protein
MKTKPSQNAHRGSDFRDFLAEEGILPEVEVLALKRVVSLQLQHEWGQVRMGWQERMDLENPGKPRLKATARGVDDKLTQPIGNACFFLKLAPFGSGYAFQHFRHLTPRRVALPCGSHRLFRGRRA